MAVNYGTRINAWLTWIYQLMRLSYSQETLVPGCRAPAASALLEQPRQMPSAAHVQARRDPGQGHSGLGAQLPGIT